MTSGFCRRAAMGALFAVLLAGCAKDAINKDSQTTFLNSDDMIKMTDQMAQSILADAFIQQEMAKGPLRIVIKPVINETSEIIVDNRKELFVARLQGLLAQNQSLRGRFVWVINREDYDKLRAEEIPESKLGAVEGGRIEPDFALYAHFLSDTQATLKGRSDIYLCQYQLTRISGAGTGVMLWTGQYETSKKVKKEFLD